MAFEVKDKNMARVGGLVDTFYHTLDPKKRLTIPSEWRDAMGMGELDKDSREYVYVLPNATEACLDLVPMVEMQQLREKMAAQDILDNDPAAASIWQVAQMLKVDTAGRIRIGDGLLAFAGITGAVTLVGAFRKAQIWAGEKKPKRAQPDIAAYRMALAARRAGGAPA